MGVRIDDAQGQKLLPVKTGIGFQLGLNGKQDLLPRLLNLRRLNREIVQPCQHSVALFVPAASIAPARRIGQEPHRHAGMLPLGGPVQCVDLALWAQEALQIDDTKTSWSIIGTSYERPLDRLCFGSCVRQHTRIARSNERESQETKMSSCLEAQNGRFVQTKGTGRKILSWLTGPETRCRTLSRCKSESC